MKRIHRQYAEVQKILCKGYAKLNKAKEAKVQEASCKGSGDIMQSFQKDP